MSTPAAKEAPATKGPEKSSGVSQFATFMILCPTSFFLGMLFFNLPYDYPILWIPPNKRVGDPFTELETHLKLLHASPPLIPRILHIVIGIGLTGFFIKLFKPTESNMLFDGASLAMYVIGIVIYVSNIVAGLRTVTSGDYSTPVPKLTGEDPGQQMSRVDSLKVLSASNTILALVLIGVLVLQAGQWYAEKKDIQDAEKFEKAREERKAGQGKKKM